MSSTYTRHLNSLVSFINDTKPFHSKLTEVQEVYQFSDDMVVKIDETTQEKLKLTSFWLNEYFSDGRATNASGGQRSLQIPFSYSPLFRGIAESTFSTAQKSNCLQYIENIFDQNNKVLSDLVIRRDGHNIFTHQGLDYHVSHGAYVFQIRQTTKVGYKEWAGKQVFVTTLEMDAPFPVTRTVSITGADDIKVRTGDAEKISSTQIKIFSPGTVIVDGFSNQSYAPLISEKHKEGVLAIATDTTLALALDKSNPASAYNRIKSLLDSISGTIATNGSTNTKNALQALYTLLETTIPQSFDALINSIIADGIPPPIGYIGWRGVDQTYPYGDQTFFEDALYAQSPNIMFGHFTDRGQWQYAGVEYSNTTCNSFDVIDVVCNKFADSLEEWIITAYDDMTATVTGSTSGTIGTIQFGNRFSTQAISFTVVAKQNATIVYGDSVKLTPTTPVIVHHAAPLETWTIIKTDPFGYSRPVILSKRTPYILNATGEFGITIKDKSINSGSLLITKVENSDYVDISHTNDTRIFGRVRIGSQFNNQYLQFSIHNGYEFSLIDGEFFAVDIINLPPFAEDKNICYTYDNDGYDSFTSVYNTVDDPISSLFDEFKFGFDNEYGFDAEVYDAAHSQVSQPIIKYVEDYLRKIEFGYDSRFLGYDFGSFNLQFTSTGVVDGRQWRLRANADMDLPLHLHSGTPPNSFDLRNELHPSDPYAAGVYDSPDSQLGVEGWRSSNDPDTDIDLLLYYASSFTLEYYDDAINGWVKVDANVPIGTLYRNDTAGISFKIVQPPKPFIAAEVNGSRYDNNAIIRWHVSGGDCITWTTRNPDPEFTMPVLVSDRAPRILMHSKYFGTTRDVDWTLYFTNNTTYKLDGIGIGGNSGELVSYGKIDFNVDGFSVLKPDASIAYTIIPGIFGFGRNDQIKFKTFSTHPKYLVHGSLSGWQKPAEFNKYYWNGKIGFKVTPAECTLHKNSELVGTGKSWVLEDGVLEVTYVSHDITDSQYIVDYKNGRWILVKSGTVLDTGNELLTDGFITIKVPAERNTGNVYTLTVDSDDFDYALANDVVVYDGDGFRTLQTTDSVFIERSIAEDVYFHLDNSVDNSPLLTQPQPLGFLDLTTNQEPEFTLNSTSPEVELFSAWIPTSHTQYDVVTSIAEFKDSATEYKISSIGNKSAFASLKNGTLYFDEVMHNTFLNINASVGVLSHIGGYSDEAVINLHEHVMFFLSGSSSTDALFEDEFAVSIGDTSLTKIKELAEDAITSVFSDTGFTGFLPGYDNLPYDEETFSKIGYQGYYDPGIPLVSSFQEAKELLVNPNRTANEERILADRLAELGKIGTVTELADMTILGFVNRISTLLSSDPEFGSYINSQVVYGFGIPNKGHAISMTDKPQSDMGTSIVDTMMMSSSSVYGFDSYFFDEDKFDSAGGNEFDLITSVPSISGGSYSNFSNLEVTVDGIVRISGSGVANKQLYYWDSAATAPKLITTTRINSDTLEFSVAKKTTLKIASI